MNTIAALSKLLNELKHINNQLDTLRRSKSVYKANIKKRYPTKYLKVLGTDCDYDGLTPILLKPAHEIKILRMLQKDFLIKKKLLLTSIYKIINK